MTSNQFLYSLFLVLVAQVPLVIKLWLDYKERSAPYRKHLYERQTEVFVELYTALTNYFLALHGGISTIPPTTEAADEHQDFINEIKKSCSTAMSKWSDTLKRSEMLLPAQLVGVASEYDTASTRILGAIIGIRTLSDAELEQEWETLTTQYNTIVNMMRLALGIDALSQQIHSLVIKRHQQLVIAKRGLPRTT